MADELTDEFRSEGIDITHHTVEHQLDLRYQGQAHELIVTVDAGTQLSAVIERFEAAFEREYGRRDLGRSVELVDARIIIRVPVPMPSWVATSDDQGAGVP